MANVFDLMAVLDELNKEQCLEEKIGALMGIVMEGIEKIEWVWEILPSGLYNLATDMKMES